ncbi:hypothetical protein N0V85_008607 [Neurospora sp. IMI 360204]|nr:hypothetical protein N0V85_008607 [Neurospora sp. IMI 360204]
MRDQDMEVEALARIVRRQKEMGLAINDEVERQTNMLDTLNTNVDVVDKKLRVAKGRAPPTEGDHGAFEEEDEQGGDDDSFDRMIFVMSSEESSVAEAVVLPTVVQGEQQDEVLHRVRHGRLRLRRDQWLYESLSDANDGDDHSSIKNEKSRMTKSPQQQQQQQQQQEDEGEREGKEEGAGKGRPSVGGEEGNMFDAVLLLCVKGVLAGVQGFWLLQWVLGRLSDVLTRVVEFGLLLLGQPTESFS